MPEQTWHDFNDLWNYNDPAATEEVFRDLLSKRTEDTSPDYILQLQTQIARTLGLQGKFEAAHQMLDEVQEEMEPASLVEVRYLLERGRCFNSDKQPEKAMPLFLQASALGAELGADFFTVDALHMLGIAAPAKARLDWNHKAIAAAEASQDERGRGWLGSLYNNTGWTLFDEGRLDEALDLFRKALAFREQEGEAEKIEIAKWCVARGLRATGEVEAALAMHRELEAAGTSDGFVFEEIGECLNELDKADEAKPYFAKAYEALSKIDWVAEDAERMQRLKQLAGL